MRRGCEDKFESSGSQLLLTEEEWLKKEKEEGKFLLTRDEWIRRSKGCSEQRNQGKEGYLWRS